MTLKVYEMGQDDMYNVHMHAEQESTLFTLPSTCVRRIMQADLTRY